MNVKKVFVIKKMIWAGLARNHWSLNYITFIFGKHVVVFPEQVWMSLSFLDKYSGHCLTIIVRDKQLCSAPNILDNKKFGGPNIFLWWHFHASRDDVYRQNIVDLEALQSMFIWFISLCMHECTSVSDFADWAELCPLAKLCQIIFSFP